MTERVQELFARTLRLPAGEKLKLAAQLLERDQIELARAVVERALEDIALQLPRRHT